MINGALLDINLAESVLSGATRISGAVNFVPADVRNKYPAIFTSKNTEFKQLKGSATISDGKARTDDLVVSAAEFETQGKGWFAFDHTVDLRALLLLSQQLSQDIISRARRPRISPMIKAGLKSHSICLDNFLARNRSPTSATSPAPWEREPLSAV